MLGWAAMMHIECIQYTVAMSLSKLIIKKIFKKRSMPLPPKWSKNKRNQAFIKIGQNTLKPKKRKIKKTVATKQHYSECSWETSRLKTELNEMLTFYYAMCMIPLQKYNVWQIWETFCSEIPKWDGTKVCWLTRSHRKRSASQ